MALAEKREHFSASAMNYGIDLKNVNIFSGRKRLG